MLASLHKTDIGEGNFGVLDLGKQEATKGDSAIGIRRDHVIGIKAQGIHRTSEFFADRGDFFFVGVGDFDDFRLFLGAVDFRLGNSGGR